MNERQDTFCRAFVGETNFNATRAYLTAYPDVQANSAGTMGYELLKNPEIQQRITELMRERSERLDLAADDVLRILWASVTVDPNELVEVRRVPCRHCYGDGFRYQFTPAEWEEVQRRHEATCHRAQQMGDPLPPEPDLKGGVGYDQRFPPFPDCPECSGFGIERVLIKPTAELSPAAKMLYAGAKHTKNGIEILTHSVDKRIELIGRHLAMFTDTVNHKNNGGSFKPMTLDQFYAKPPDSDA